MALVYAQWVKDGLAYKLSIHRWYLWTNGPSEWVAIRTGSISLHYISYMQVVKVYT